MDDTSTTGPLTAQLTAEYGDVVPATLITQAVSAAWQGVPSHDEQLVSSTARTDVAALADAVARRTSADDVAA